MRRPHPAGRPKENNVPTVKPAFLDAAFRAHNEALLHHLRRLSRNDAVAQDVSQQSWLRLLSAHARGEPLPDGRELRAYLFTVARHAFIDGYRRRHFERRTVRVSARDLEHLAEAEPAHGPEEAAERHALEALVANALDDLPPAQQQAVRLWQAGHDLRTMCERAGAPRETVLSRKKYAFAKLRQRLESVAGHFVPELAPSVRRAAETQGRTPKSAAGSLSIA